MPRRNVLVIDVNHMANRAFHSTGNLSYNEVRTGVIFGVLRDIENLRDTFLASHIALCFDCGLNKRKEIYKGYKEKRHAKRTEWTVEEWRAYEELQSQIYMMRTLYLPQIGYSNVLFKKGYESDDMVASVVQGLKPKDEAVIISSDKDFYQLLAPNVVQYDPNKKATMTANGFRARYSGLEPRYWPRVLALAGCGTDEVPGIPGVGVPTAVKYLQGEMKEDSKVYLRIRSDRGRERIARNRRLVELPLEGTPVFEIKDDTITTEGWNKVMKFLGIRSFERKPRQRTLWDV